MIIKKNDIIDLNITNMTCEGFGIGRYEGIVIFVPMACTGDFISAKILKVKKSYAYAKIEKIKKLSVKRISVDCSSYSKCGGCCLRHVDYDYELEIKSQKVRDSILRVGGFENIIVNDIVPSPLVDFYRNKAQIPVKKNKMGEVVLGFFSPHSHNVVESENCFLQPREFSSIIQSLKLWMKKYDIDPYDENEHKGLIRHLYIRSAKDSKEIMVCVVVNSNSEIKSQNEMVKIFLESNRSIKTILLNFNTHKTNVILGNVNKILYGDGYITDEICGIRFKISANSFYQVNRQQTENLYKKALDYANVDEKDILLDLYCGIGTIGLTMAPKVKKLIGVEIVQEAVIDAQNNAKINNIHNAEFICSDVKKAVELLKKRNELPSVVILDPPRKGCDTDTIQSILEFNPRRIVYISCNPSTLSRDLKIFCEKNYSVSEITPFDMFPRTGHVETVVLMSRVKD